MFFRSPPQDRPTSNGYIEADRLYDLNPMPLMTSSVSSLKLHPAADVGPATAPRNGDPATLLQYSATYGNPYLRPNSAQWPPAQKLDAYGRPEPPPYSAVKSKRKNVAGSGLAQQVPVGPNYHIGVAKRQTLATHV